MVINKVVRHGGTLAVTLSKEICRGLSIQRGDFVALLINANNNLEIVKLRDSDQWFYRERITNDIKM